MTLYELDVAPDDVAARDLGYRVDSEPAPAALATMLLDHPQHPIALRVAILGASHAVTVVIDGNDAFTEEVSCRPLTAGRGLPTAVEYRQGPLGVHRLTGTVETLSRSDFSGVVDELTARAHDEPTVVAGRFPGPDGALTVVAATADNRGWQWRTWHLYPASDVGDPEPGTPADGGVSGRVDVGGDVVTTESGFELAGAVVGAGVGAGLATEDVA